MYNFLLAISNLENFSQISVKNKLNFQLLKLLFIVLFLIFGIFLSIFLMSKFNFKQGLLNPYFFVLLKWKFSAKSIVTLS